MLCIYDNRTSDYGGSIFKSDDASIQQRPLLNKLGDRTEVTFNDMFFIAEYIAYCHRIISDPVDVIDTKIGMLKCSVNHFHFVSENILHLHQIKIYQGGYVTVKTVVQNIPLPEKEGEFLIDLAALGIRQEFCLGYIVPVGKIATGIENQLLQGFVNDHPKIISFAPGKMDDLAAGTRRAALSVFFSASARTGIIRRHIRHCSTSPKIFTKSHSCPVYQSINKSSANNYISNSILAL